MRDSTPLSMSHSCCGCNVIVLKLAASVAGSQDKPPGRDDQPGGTDAPEKPGGAWIVAALACGPRGPDKGASVGSVGRGASGGWPINGAGRPV